jgi:tetratricopeptide (TPR) repeat protein
MRAPSRRARGPFSFVLGEAAAARQSWRVLPGLVVVLTVLVAYAQAIGGPLLWDDRYLILDVPLVERDAPLIEHLKRPLWSGDGVQHLSHAYYRPLVTLSFSLDHRLHGPNSGGYHLTNIVIHALAALALFTLLRRFDIRPWTSAALAAGWALLPRLAEVGAWISGRADGLAGLFVLLSLLAWGPTLGRRALAALLVGIGLLAKESAAAGIAAIFCLEWVSARGLPLTRRLQRVITRCWPFAPFIAGYLTLRLGLVGYRTETDPLSSVARVRSVLEAVATYASMLLDPLRPSALIGRVGAVTLTGTLVGTVILAVCALLAWRFRRRVGEIQAIGLGLFVFALFPVLHIVPIPVRTLAADRFLYLPTAGLVLALAPSVDSLFRARPRSGIGALAVLGLLFVCCVRRVGVWSNEVDFWVSTYLAAPPTNHAATVELSGVYFRAGRYEEALELSERALHDQDPNRRNPLRNSAVCLAHLGRRGAALQRLNESEKGRPVAAEDTLLVALIELQDGNFDRASATLARVTGPAKSLAAPLAAQLPMLHQAYVELEHLDPGSSPERRAHLATLLGDRPRALPAWIAAVSSPRITKPVLREAIHYLVQAGDRDALERAVRAYVARFGPLDPLLGSMVDVRADELDQLSAAWKKIGPHT